MSQLWMSHDTILNLTVTYHNFGCQSIVCIGTNKNVKATSGFFVQLHKVIVIALVTFHHLPQ